MGIDEHQLVENLALHLESAFCSHHTFFPFHISFVFGSVLLYHHLISFFPSATQKWDMLSGLSKFVWHGGKRIVDALFLYRWFLVFCAHIDFPFNTCLDKKLERWGQRHVPRGHELAIVGNLYSLFIKEVCLSKPFTVLFYFIVGGLDPCFES